MTGSVQAAARIKQATLQAVIIRADGSREDLGTVSYYHRNPLRRLAWRLSRWMKGIRK